MSASFNVLDQAWIPVVTIDGKEKMLGIRETLVNAHELREISSVSPLEEYSLYRFLGLFLMDALRPESELDIEDFLDAGSFDQNLIEAYIAQCRSEGVSFDLFDEDRPFLQSKYDPAMDGDPKPVTVLDFTRANGNNHTHFDHDPKVAAITPATAARLLPTYYTFLTMEGRGYGYSINEKPPYYGVIKGHCLFETLINSMLPTDSIGYVFDDPPVFWRRETPIARQDKSENGLVGKTSWMGAMFFPARRITLIPEEDMSVKWVYHSPGEKFLNADAWRDPYVTYMVGKDGFFPMRPSADRAIWRNLSDIVNIPGGQASQLLTTYRNLQYCDTVDLTLYGVETDQASYLGIYRHSFSFPLALTEKGNTVDMLRLCIQTSETLANALRKAFSKIAVLPDAAASLSVQQYYQACEKRFWHFCDQAATTAPGKEDLAAFCDDAADYAENAFSAAVGSLNLRAAALAVAEKQRGILYKSIKKLKKEVRL